ncbi:hypothetical protein OIV57_17490 [Burkholderia pseudomallei]|uniref:hypothetical protein n=1 Tax=Burkholderia pseudomallei TaxID=28450 RepID=UPI0021F6F21F|nr:hypothetical protein [Burkholderia pseudomallei]MCV9913931.1 hypothetical protein [Burkholderia pseudomallei]MCW0071265.1 hypothetical protein [Burkholderia pseudomallei]
MNRAEELLKKGYGKLTALEKIELAQLLEQEAEGEKEKELEAAYTEIENFITGKGIKIEDFVKKYQVAEVEPIYFNVPYQTTDSKGKTHSKIYKWHFGKKAVGLTAKYYQKLVNADKETKLQWATEQGKAWMDTDEGKRWLAGAN